jgi:Flp pilus assembly protein TadG
MLKRFLRGNSGSAVVELALTAPLLMLIMIGAAELGRIAYYAIEVQTAARAGADYGAQNSVTAVDSTDIEQAAVNDVPNITDLTATATNACVCETNYASGATPTYNSTTPGSCTVSAITGCNAITSTSVESVVSYVVVNTQVTVKPMFHYPGIPSSFTLSGYSQMRVIQN